MNCPLDKALSRRLRAPPLIRTTSIYSPPFGVVAWQICCQHERSCVVHAELRYACGRDRSPRSEPTLSMALI